MFFSKEVNAMEEVDTEKYVKNEAGYKILKCLLYPVAIPYKPTIYGKENIPAEGGVIIASNHRKADDPAFAVMATKRVIHWLAKKELHESKFKWFFEAAGTIPVNRGVHHTGVMEVAEAMLEQGYVIGIYPEGTRNKTEDPIQPLKYGAVRLAQKTGAWIVPLSIAGINGAFKSNVRTCIGEPYKIAADADLDQENEILRKKLARLYLEAEEKTKE